jgi:hypothetical protein
MSFGFQRRFGTTIIAPAVVNSSLSGMDTKRMSEVHSDSDRQYTSAPPNRPAGELSRLPHTYSLHLEDLNVFHCVVKLVVCAVKEIQKLRFNDFKYSFYLVSLLLRAAGAEASTWPV